MLAGILKRRTKTAAIAPVATTQSDDVTALAALAAQIIELDDEARALTERLDRRRASVADAEQELNTLSIHADASTAARARYQRQHQKCRELADSVDGGERGVRHLEQSRQELLREHGVVFERIAAVKRKAARERAEADLLEVTAAADVALLAGVQATENVLACFEVYKTAARADGATVQDVFPVGLCLSTFWCQPEIMKRLGTTISLSLSTASAAGRLTFGKVVAHLRKDDGK